MQKIIEIVFITSMIYMLLSIESQCGLPPKNRSYDTYDNSSVASSKIPQTKLIDIITGNVRALEQAHYKPVQPSEESVYNNATQKKNKLSVRKSSTQSNSTGRSISLSDISDLTDSKSSKTSSNSARKIKPTAPVLTKTSPPTTFSPRTIKRVDPTALVSSYPVTDSIHQVNPMQNTISDAKKIKPAQITSPPKIADFLNPTNIQQTTQKMNPNYDKKSNTLQLTLAQAHHDTLFYKTFFNKTTKETDAALHDPRQPLVENFTIAVYAGRYDYLQALATNNIAQYSDMKIDIKTIINEPIDAVLQNRALHVIVQAAQYHRSTNISELQSPMNFVYRGQHNKKYNDCLKTLQFLLDNQADPNITNTEGQSPLHLACASGDYEVAKMLINAHTDVDLQDKKTRTAFDMINRYTTDRKMFNNFTQLFKTAQDLKTKQVNTMIDNIAKPSLYHQTLSFLGLRQRPSHYAISPTDA